MCPFDGGAWQKSQYDVVHMQAIAEAGFESVRIFMPYIVDAGNIEVAINDALAYNLSIAVCMWGKNTWPGNVPQAETEIADRWGQLADLWKNYPDTLVFEILNEPEGIGFVPDHNGNVDVMGLYNEAVQAIRDVDPDQPILIGMPGHNDSEFLDPYVTEPYLTYTFYG